MQIQSSPSALNEILSVLEGRSVDQNAALSQDVLETNPMRFVPSVGPQTDCWQSKADIVYYGGAAGGGKSALLCGLGCEAHQRTLILRREFPQIKGLEDEVARIVGSREAYNQSSKIWGVDPEANRRIEFGSVPHEKDAEKYQGRAHDLKAFDEITQFSRGMFEYIIGWNRIGPDVTEPQRCRVVCAGNPPTTVEGDWVIDFWAPWLDKNHPNPAKPGELRWFTTIGGKDHECDGPDPIEVDGDMVRPKSRTFIPAKLEDNPYLDHEIYGATLAAMPAEIRDKLRYGTFDTVREDQAFQVIPLDWINVAMDRWTDRPPPGILMTAIGVDVAQGGADQTVIAPRYGNWFAELTAIDGKHTKDGPAVASRVIEHMRDGAQVNVDMGGGWGGSAHDFLKHAVQGIAVYGFNPSERSDSKTEDGKIGFWNKKAEAWWRLREALNPLNPDPITLPPDPELRRDLASPTFELTPRGYKIESKDDLKKRLGRSPDRGDAAVISWFTGDVKTKTFREQQHHPKAKLQTNYGSGGGGTRNTGSRARHIKGGGGSRRLQTKY